MKRGRTIAAWWRLINDVRERRGRGEMEREREGMGLEHVRIWSCVGSRGVGCPGIVMTRVGEGENVLELEGT
jgi:hypothetical protein